MLLTLTQQSVTHGPENIPNGNGNANSFLASAPGSPSLILAATSVNLPAKVKKGKTLKSPPIDKRIELSNKELEDARYNYERIQANERIEAGKRKRERESFHLVQNMIWGAPDYCTHALDFFLPQHIDADNNNFA
jgi:hypothetical protein